MLHQAETAYEASQGQKQRLFGETLYAAGSWDLPRRVVMKAERLTAGPNTRFVVTNLEGTPQALYDQVYVQRGEMENRIKEQQLMLFADRTSCHDFLANQFRLLLSSFANVLLETLRRVHLADTELAQAQVNTIRLKVLQVAARVVTSVRRLVFHLSSSYPGEAIFRRPADSLIISPRLGSSNSNAAKPMGERGPSAPTALRRDCDDVCRKPARHRRVYKISGLVARHVCHEVTQSPRPSKAISAIAARCRQQYLRVRSPTLQVIPRCPAALRSR